MIEKIKAYIKIKDVCSISQIETRFNLTYIQAKEIVEKLEEEGFIVRGKRPNTNKKFSVEVY
jgi:DNA-binding MarR family transcriptional regulator